MKATRAEYLHDLREIEDALCRFLYKHGRSAVRDLDALYAVESVMESGYMEPTRPDRTYWEDLADLAQSGFDISETVTDSDADMIRDEVTEALEGLGLVREVTE